MRRWHYRPCAAFGLPLFAIERSLPYKLSHSSFSNSGPVSALRRRQRHLEYIDQRNIYQ